MATIKSVRFIDAIGQDLPRVVGLNYWQQRLIASYTTRIFAASDSQFHEIRHPIKIDQAPTDQLFRGAQVKDVESGAGSIQNAVNIAKQGHSFVVYLPRLQNGFSLAECRAAMHAAGIPAGRVHYWVADWTASETRALQLLASAADIVAVQWASPTEGGNLVVPGSNGQSVKQLNVDMNVGRLDFWLPGHPAPKPESKAKGVWRASIEHDMETELWRIHPEPGQNVQMDSKMISDNFAGSVDRHTGVWHIQGVKR
jgi:hypothetical protein